MERIILKTNHLTKCYKNFAALDNVNITINRGDIYGLIGRNGAGKTTLMKVITTLAAPTKGSFSLFGKEAELMDSKAHMGSLIESPAFFDTLTAYQNLKFYALQKGITDLGRIDEVLELVNLTEARKKAYKGFSLGMKQRLGIALAMLDHPDFVILDEPINGLDPIGISELRETLLKINEINRVTLLISSHILSELYLLATKFCFIEKGKVVKECTKEELDAECGKSLVIKTPDVDAAAVVLEKKLNITDYKVVSKNEIRIYTYLDKPSLVNKILVENGIEVLDFKESGISLEEYFKQLVQEVK